MANTTKSTSDNFPLLQDREQRLTRIFQIGYNKCGTRSLFRFLKKSGIPSVHFNKGMLALGIEKNIGAGRKPLHEIDQFTAYTDMQFVAKHRVIEAVHHFRTLYQYYPNSYFILNTRDRDDWINSRLNHGAGGYPERYRKGMKLKNIDAVVEHWKADWDRHHKDVEEFFADKPGQLLVFTVGKDDPQRIVEFLKPDFDTDAKHFGHEGDTKKINAAKYTKGQTK